MTPEPSVSPQMVLTAENEILETEKPLALMPGSFGLAPETETEPSRDHSSEEDHNNPISPMAESIKAKREYTKGPSPSRPTEPFGKRIDPPNYHKLHSCLTLPTEACRE